MISVSQKPKIVPFESSVDEDIIARRNAPELGVPLVPDDPTDLPTAMSLLGLDEHPISHGPLRYEPMPKMSDRPHYDYLGKRVAAAFKDQNRTGRRVCKIRRTHRRRAPRRIVRRAARRASTSSSDLPPGAPSSRSARWPCTLITCVPKFDLRPSLIAFRRLTQGHRNQALARNPTSRLPTAPCMPVQHEHVEQHESWIAAHVGATRDALPAAAAARICSSRVRDADFQRRQ